MPIDIEAGTIMVRSGLPLPNALRMSSSTYSKNWEIVSAQDASALNRAVRAAGWYFMLSAGVVRAAAFGRREGINARHAVDRLLAKIQAEYFNAVEVTEISTKHFLGIPYLSLTAHARHLQQGQTLLDQAGRRRAQQDWDLTRGY